MILKILSYVGALAGLVFATGALTAGLYYILVNIEEHTVFAKRILTRIIYANITIHVLLLLFEGFPVKLTLFSLATNVVHLQNLKQFPYISLTSGLFVTNCICVVCAHFLWLNYFTDSAVPPYSIFKTNPSHKGATHPSIVQVSSFLGLCVWIVPLALFLSISASDNTLPTSNYIPKDESGAAKARRRSMGLAKLVLSHLYDWTVKLAHIMHMGRNPEPDYELGETTV